MSIMRKIAKWLIRYKFLFFAIAIVIAFGGEVITQGNEVGMRVIISSIGIDKEAGGYNVSAQVFTPQLDETKSQAKSVVSVKAPTIADALNQMSLTTGRIAILAHCRLIVLGDSCMQESVIKTLSFFQLEGSVSWGAIVVATSGEAKKTLEGLNTLEQKAAFSWQKFLDSNREFDTVTVMSLRELFIRNNDKSESFLLNIIDIKESEQESGGAQATASEGASSGGAEKSGEAKGELNMGDKTFVMKKGKKVGQLGRDEVRGYSWLDDKVGKAVFAVSDIDDPNFLDATVSVRLNRRKVKVSCHNTNGTPVLKIKVEAVFDSIEKLKEEHEHLMTPDEVKRSNVALQKAINRTIKEQIESCVKKSNELDADILGIDNMFFRYQTALFDKLGKDLYKEAQIDYNISAVVAL